MRGRWSAARDHRRCTALARSRHLVGEWTADKRRKLVVRVPELVERAAWERAQAQLDGYGLRGKPRSKHVHLLEGVLRCGLCGGPVWISAACTRRQDGYHRPAYYVCKSRLRARAGDARCQLPMRRTADLDARTWARLADYLAAPDLVAAAIGAAGPDAGAAWAADLATYERQLGDLEQRERALVERFAAGQIAAGALDGALAKNRDRRQLLRANVAAARSQAEAYQRARERGALARASAHTLASRVEGATAEDRRELVRLLVPGTGEHVAVLDAAGRVRLGVRDLAVATASAAACSDEPRAHGLVVLVA